MEQAPEGADLVGSFRSWVLGAHRAQGMPEDEIARYDRHTFWATQVDGIRRWLDQRDAVS